MNDASKSSPAPAQTPAPADAATDYVRIHLRFGYWALLVFLCLGIALEALNGFKIGWYLDVGNEARRLTLRLAHVHGTLFAVLNLIFGLTFERWPDMDAAARRWASTSLRAGTVVLPLGFFGGGLFIYGGDPGLAVGLVPIGALLVAVAVFVMARAASGRS